MAGIYIIRIFRAVTGQKMTNQLLKKLYKYKRLNGTEQSLLLFRSIVIRVPVPLKMSIIGTDEMSKHSQSRPWPNSCLLYTSRCV